MNEFRNACRTKPPLRADRRQTGTIASRLGYCIWYDMTLKQTRNRLTELTIYWGPVPSDVGHGGTILQYQTGPFTNDFHPDRDVYSGQNRQGGIAAQIH